MELPAVPDADGQEPGTAYVGSRLDVPAKARHRDLAISILLWAASTFQESQETDRAGCKSAARRRSGYSFTGRSAEWMEPAIKPLGFDWKIGTALIGAFAAKEVFVAQMGMCIPSARRTKNPRPCEAN
jgi:Fe2+ transport system protein B